MSPTIPCTSRVQHFHFDGDRHASYFANPPMGPGLMTVIPPGGMNGDRRLDSRVAGVVTSALRLSSAKGRVQAWNYLRKQAIPTQIALRVLSSKGARRSSDARPDHQAFTVPGTNAGGTEQLSMQVTLSGSEEPTPKRRVNQVTELICERAIAALLTDSREYAESLLRIYSLKTTTIMRVLYHPELRRQRVGDKID